MRPIDAETLERQIMLLPDENLCEDCCFTFVNAINDAPTVELTDEAAIEHLHKTGWMQNHDREMTRAPWISVKDRLPEPPAQCLVYSAKASRPRGMETATYTEFGWMMAAYFPDITHWMPLPEPPEEDHYGSGAV